jgi:homoserine dehydrogenase
MPGKPIPSPCASRDDVDVFVEVMGGIGRPGKGRDRGRDCRRQGHVVTANKALLAHHGQALAEAAEAGAA